MAANRRVNSISSLVGEGETVEDPSMISNSIVDFYSSMYEEPCSWRLNE